MNTNPTDPLPPIDANGAKLAPGMRVRILTIPDWLTHDLPDEDVLRLKKVEGTIMPIDSFDVHGYVWFEQWFCLRPSEVAVEC